MELSVRSVKHEVNTSRLSRNQEGLPQTFELGLCRVRVFADAKNRICMQVCVCKGTGAGSKVGRRKGQHHRGKSKQLRKSKSENRSKGI